MLKIQNVRALKRVKSYMHGLGPLAELSKELKAVFGPVKYDCRINGTGPDGKPKFEFKPVGTEWKKR
jgi:hypothetical protein